MRRFVVLRDGDGVAEKRDIVTPEVQLPVREHQAGRQRQTGDGANDRSGNLKPFSAVANAQRQRQKNSDAREISVTVGHRRAADLHQANHRHKRSQKPEPADEAIRA